MPWLIIAAIVAAAGSAVQQRKAGKQQKRASQREQRIADAENVRSRRQAIRERIIQQSQLNALGAATGTSASSGIQGASASLGSQTASNIGFQTQLEALNKERLSFLGKAAQAQTHAGTFEAVSKIASAAG